MESSFTSDLVEHCNLVEHSNLVPQTIYYFTYDNNTYQGTFSGSIGNLYGFANIVNTTNNQRIDSYAYNADLMCVQQFVR
jgi:hypothetical protein